MEIVKNSPTTLKVGFTFKIKGKPYEVTRLTWKGKEIVATEFVSTDTGEQFERTFDQVMKAQEDGMIEHDYPSDETIDNFKQITEE